MKVTKMKGNKISFCFDNKCVEIPISVLLPLKKLSEKIKYSKKYQQILSSILAVGLVEPIIVYPSKEDNGKFNIIDGYLRVEILKELKFDNAPCLITTLEDTFSYNKRVSKLNPIQEHKMILKAIDSGVSIGKLSEALGITEKTIKSRFRLLDGICSEVVNLLKDKDVPKLVFAILKKMKPLRQIEVANSMISLNNYSHNFIYSMLSCTPEELLRKDNKKNNADSNSIDAIKKLQSELSTFDDRKKELQESYAENSLQLVVIKSHVKKLLSNSKVINWLYDNNPDYLKQLKYISGLDTI